ncbi:MAG: hypothetical protein RIR11_1805 [Bacteroidota bacterium]|jgi:hypothetical protein
MQTKDFTVFQILLSEIHQKAFNEPISKLSFSKAQMLSWLISNDTNQIISYKSLIKYVDAVMVHCPQSINPNLTTLLILVEYQTGQKQEKLPALVLWTAFQKTLLMSSIEVI